MTGRKSIFARLILMFASVASGCALLLAAPAIQRAAGSTATTAAPVAIQQGEHGQAVAPLTINASFTDKKQTAPDEAIELRLNRQLSKSEERLAVFIRQIDMTSLFAPTENVLRYNPTLLSLPLGESDVTVYLIASSGEWKEIAHFPLHVSTEKAVEPESKIESSASNTAQSQPDKSPVSAAKTEKPSDAEPKSADTKAPTADKAETTGATQAQAMDAKSGAESGKKPDAAPPTTNAQQSSATTEKAPHKILGFDKLGFTPSLTLSVKSQPAQSNFPESTRPDRPTFTDLTMQGSIKTEMTRGLFSSQMQFDFVGASFQKDALRFGQLGDQAPQVDLTSYLTQIQIGKVKYQMGQFSYGTERHLMNSFSSRGMMLSLPIGGHGEFSLAAMNGTSVVGFDNFFGLANRHHQLLSATLGWEFLPKHPGGLRLEVAGLDGWLQPVNSFTQASVNDAERSQGITFRLLMSDPAQRFKFDGGFTRSQFVKPSDALLNQTANVKPFPEVTRNARYVDASAQVLKDKPLTKDKKINLTFSLRHEQVDPLFRSLGASAQADKFSNEFSAIAAIGDINAQFTHSRFNDNLADIPSILKSLTRANTLTIGVPLAALFSNPQKPSPLWPRLSYTFNQTHQFGAAIPLNGGFDFDPGAIPDQVSTNQAFTADWQIQKVRFGYRFNHSLQDNRQIGFEQADLAALVNGFSFGISPRGTLDLGLDINDENSNNRGARTIDRTLRLAPTINWRMNKKMTFASNFSTTVAGDDAQTKHNRNTEFDMQWTYQFGLERDRFRKVQGQFFIRYANRYAFTRNNLIVQQDLQKTQIVNLGLSLNFF